ncbi:MAG: hypothetical protein NTW59_01715, partial [Candidatus Diapherotrites archaeon]|nr:hypothetical protein [Candidatus Diapherotrites archaeon]
PNGMQKISVVNMCGDTAQLECATGVEDLCDCTTPIPQGGGAHGGISRSAIRIEMAMIGGNIATMWECKGKIFLVGFPKTLAEIGDVTGGPPYTIRASWTETGKIELRKV